MAKEKGIIINLIQKLNLVIFQEIINLEEVQTALIIIMNLKPKYR